jgi:serine/threonine protein kinase
MSILEELIGQVLDEKYKIEKQLGQGGMGAVYMATHVGTRRPVALKVITPQFMTHPEFVERFRREAEAAGRLRHPNVVDVTDFGFAEVGRERLAYLVMEYLDGCALSDVMKEEKRLPLSWVVDIIEQVCLAIDKAHGQGIIHRDLKPDNIWLEPNERGGYTVKVLDFGLAKLADSSVAAAPISAAVTSTPSITAIDSPLVSMATIAQPGEDYREAMTQAQASAIPDEERTAVQPASSRSTDPGGEHQTAPSGGLTQAGAVLGTPLYMSPEQCLGKPLDSRSDIYSLGLIAYEMLAGETPFTGGMMVVMAQHINTPPPPLKEKRANLPEKVSALIMSAIEKDPEKRPASAAGFASALRARAEGPSAMVRQAFALYSDNFHTFFRISLLAYIPSLLLHAASIGHAILEKSNPKNPFLGPILLLIFLFAIFSTMFSQAVNAGFFVPVVVQLLIAPLRSLALRPAFEALKKRLRVFVPASLVYSVGQFMMIMSAAFLVGFIVAIGKIIASSPDAFLKKPMKMAVITAIPIVLGLICFGLIKATLNYFLYAPVAIMEGVGGRAVLRRSKALSYKSRKAVKFILYIYLANFILHSILAVLFKIFVTQPSSLAVASLLTVLFHISSASYFLLINPLLAVMIALLYFKTRQTDGELLKDVLSQYERETLPAHNWQLRMRTQPKSILKSMKSNNSI